MPSYKCLHGLCTDKDIETAVLKVVGCSVTPNTWTLLNLVVVIPLLLKILSLPQNLFVWVALLVAVVMNRILDIIDGGVARSCDMKSNLGALLDIFTDLCLAVGMLVVYLSVWLGSTRHNWWSVVVLLGLLGSAVSHFSQFAREWTRTADAREIFPMETLFADNSMILLIVVIVIVKLSLEQVR